MKAITGILIIGMFFCSCQKEVFYETEFTDTQTDTSIVLKKKTVYHLGFGEDSVLTIYKRNKINGVKGYIIYDTGYTLGYRSKAEFKYNNAGHLTDIIQTANAPTSPFTSIKKITWQGNKLRQIYWTENGTIRMNREFDYFVSGDSLHIEYDINSSSPGFLDSSRTVIICDTSMKKMFGLFTSGVIDIPLLGTQSIHVGQTSYNYLGNNLMFSKQYLEVFNTGTSVPYTHLIDSAVLRFTRDNQASTFLNDLENDVLGKELRILAYNQNDSISWWFDDFFNYGNQNLTHLSNSSYFFRNIYTGVFSPMTNATIDYVIYHDGTENDRKTSLLLKKQTYTYDALFRIKSIKEYDSQTNQLLSETYFYYP